MLDRHVGRVLDINPSTTMGAGGDLFLNSAIAVGAIDHGNSAGKILQLSGVIVGRRPMTSRLFGKSWQPFSYADQCEFAATKPGKQFTLPFVGIASRRVWRMTFCCGTRGRPGESRRKRSADRRCNGRSARVRGKPEAVVSRRLLPADHLPASRVPSNARVPLRTRSPAPRCRERRPGRYRLSSAGGSGR